MLCLNINLENKAFIWLPFKVGSTLNTVIINNLGFNAYNIQDNNFTKVSESAVHHHTCDFFLNHEDFDFLLPIRNPYSLVVSLYFQKMNSNREKVDIDSFNIYLNNVFEEPERAMFRPFDFMKRIPEYPLRLENLYSDYIQMPWVRDSLYNLNGGLKKDCESILNKGRYDFDYRDFYDKNSADRIWYNLSNLFELGEYDKNSWKK